MKNKNFKLLGLIFLLVCFCNITSLINAASTITTISAQLSYDIKMKLHNQTFSPIESDGTSIIPITYKGRTYLPVRALGEAMNIAIDYDNVNKTIYIGERDWTPVTVNMFKSQSVSDYYFQYTLDKDMLGKGYKSGLVYNKLTNNNTNINSGSLSFDKAYTKIKFSAYKNTNADIDLVVRDASAGYDKEVILKVFKLDTESQDFEVDISNVSKLYFGLINHTEKIETKVVIGDMFLK